MGRPKVHDEATRATLLRAAENLAETEGLSAVSLRRLAAETGLSTRAAYSTFGSKAGLIDALGALAFEWLGDQVQQMPETDDPARDLVETGQIYRRLAIEHTVIFRIGYQSETRDMANPLIRRAAERALEQLRRKVERVVPPERVRNAVLDISALCEGLAAHELRGSFDADRDPVQTWRSALSTHVAGLALLE